MLKRKIPKKIWIIAGIVVAWYLAALPFPSGPVTYGVSFSKFHSDELKLNWKEVYLALLDDLKVRHFRLSAHWPMIEPAEGRYNFKELDFQMDEARRRGASVILAVGRRLPGWPECHEPSWIPDFEKSHAELDEQEHENSLLLEYIERVVKRYKDYPNLKYWQVENEPFLGFFGRHTCHRLNEKTLQEEIALVRKLDSHHPILVTDSGEFGTWRKAYRHGDVFGSSMYLYVWSKILGPIRYPLGASFFRVKKNIVRLLEGDKPMLLIELSAEPWLLQPIVETPIETQLKRMGSDKFNKMIALAKQAGFREQYLWGAEWWYWLKQQGNAELWQAAKKVLQYGP